MIDYIKVRLNQNGLPSNILQNPSLDFIKKYTKNQSIIWVAEYSKMKFEIYENSGIVDVSGSLHYLGNEGVHNWNDFSRIELRNTIGDL